VLCTYLNFGLIALVSVANLDPDTPGSTCFGTEPDPLTGGMDPDTVPAPDPGSSYRLANSKETLITTICDCSDI
jgi:hypothetical protein